ncbi:MAG: killer suppression protein [Bdellovibrionaceae bacterium]|nr:killer suppression protein [Pseudobdellovibrionaceae bacterium]
MQIIFNDRKLEKVCNSQKDLVRTFGKECAARIRRRLDDLAAAPSLETLRPPFPGRCHELKADRQGQLSLDLQHPYRLIFEPIGEGVKRKDDGGLDWSSVQAVRVLDVEDTHG